MSADKSVTVVIPTYNRATFLRRCVESVLRSDYSGPLDVVIVDDCSTDETRNVCSFLAREHPRVEFASNSRNHGQAYCRNLGAEIARGKYILFLDDDNEIAGDAIGKLVWYCERKRDARLVSPLAVNVDVRGGKMKTEKWTLGLRFHPYLSICQQVLGSTHHANETEHAPNAYMIERELFRMVRGIDARFRIYEEADLSFRLRKFGKKTYILPRAETYHYHGLGGSASELRRFGIESVRRAYWMQHFRCVFWKRHYPIANWLCVILFSCPALSAYYALKALKHGRIDIAAASVWGWVSGAFASVFEKGYSR